MSERKVIVILGLVISFLAACYLYQTVKKNDLEKEVAELRRRQEDVLQIREEERQQDIAGEKALKEENYPSLADLVRRVKEAEAGKGDLEYELYVYTITVAQWGRLAGITKPEYLIPERFWNRWMPYSLSYGEQRGEEKGRIMFLSGKDAAGKIHLTAVVW